MSDNIPFDMQMEIIKRVPHVKSLIRFRSVSKQWKSFIDTSEFIKSYGVRHTQLYSQKQELAPLLKHFLFPFRVGACHGLLCWSGVSIVYMKQMVVIWNPSIRKSIGIVAPNDRYELMMGYQRVYSFGVCPVTSDPTVIMVLCGNNKPWHVKVFTLSSGVWNVIPTGNLPRQSITLSKSTPVVIDRFIYWSANEKTFSDNGESTTNYMVVSFDLFTKEFSVVDLPGSLKKGLDGSVSKLRESLVVSGLISVAGEGVHCDVRVMEHDLSFRKLFTIGASVQIVGFKENGETIYVKEKEAIRNTRIYILKKGLAVYDPRSQLIKNLGISRESEGSFFMGSYKESLLLLDHPDLYIYSDDS